MRMCGIVARFISTALPLMSRPRPPRADAWPAWPLARRGCRRAPRSGGWRWVLDADRLAARDGGQDAHVGRGHRVGDVLVQARDPRDLHAGTALELVAGY